MQEKIQRGLTITSPEPGSDRVQNEAIRHQSDADHLCDTGHQGVTAGSTGDGANGLWKATDTQGKK